MAVNDSNSNSVFNRTFANSEDIPIPVHYAGLDFEATVVITIIHFNFSMDVEVSGSLTDARLLTF